MWRNYRELGYRRLIYTNTVSVLEASKLAEAIGDSTKITTVLLEASDTVAEQRLSRREQGDSLLAHLQHSERAAQLLRTNAPATAIRINADRQTPVEVAQIVFDVLNW